jgi:hypothetical protein
MADAKGVKFGSQHLQGLRHVWFTKRPADSEATAESAENIAYGVRRVSDVMREVALRSPRAAVKK